MTHRYTGLAGGRRAQLRLPLSPLRAEMALTALEEWRQPAAEGQQRGWYKIRNATDDAPAQVNIFDEISWWGITAQEFCDDLAQIAGPVEVHINSPGGDAFDGITIYNALAARKDVTTVADGLAASAASVIFMAGQTRIASPGSMVMIHDALALCIGNAADMRETAALLDKVSDNIASVYAAHTARDAAYWRAQMVAEGWYTADEAVQAGLAHKTADRPGAGAQPAAAPDPAAFDRSVFVNWLRPAAAAQPHGPFTGTHTHAHPANGSQGGDASHEHEHSHDGDASHEHTHPAAAAGPGCGCCGECTGPGCGCCPMCTDDAGGSEGCATCGGSGRERHPETGQFTGPCPACAGTGNATGGDGDGAQDHGPARVLGAESMPIRAEAIPVHHTATVDEPWDGPAAVAAMPNDAAVLRYCHAWEDSAADDGTGDDPDGDADDKKASYKFPHHKTKGGPANLAACRNGLARLSGADIPDSDRAGVKAHLQAHLDDAADDDGTDDHTDHGLSDEGLAKLSDALRGAFA